MPIVNGKMYPYNDDGKMQAEIDSNYRPTYDDAGFQKDAEYGSADFSVQPDKNNYGNYGICRPHNSSLSYDGNLTTRGKYGDWAGDPNPTHSSRPIPKKEAPPE